MKTIKFLLIFIMSFTIMIAFGQQPLGVSVSFEFEEKPIDPENPPEKPYLYEGEVVVAWIYYNYPVKVLTCSVNEKFSSECHQFLFDFEHSCLISDLSPTPNSVQVWVYANGSYFGGAYGSPGICIVIQKE